MRLMACLQCRRVYNIGGNPEEIQWFTSQEVYPCITPACEGALVSVSTVPMGFAIEEVPFKNFFRAVHGFGRPDGYSAPLADAVRILTTQKIVQVKGEATGQPERVILRELIMDDGTVLHFDSSSRGACLYYIERPSPSCREVVEAENERATSSRSSPSVGEEGGRDLNPIAQPGEKEPATRCAAHISPTDVGDKSNLSFVL